MNNFIKYILPIIIIIIILYTFNNKEQLTNQSSFVLENIIVDDSCKNITPVQLFKLFNNNLDLMTKTMIDNGFSSSELNNKENYPKIATFLKRKNIISC
jgi:hypothetical protein